MSTSRNQTFVRLGIIAGIILLSILIGRISGHLDQVLTVLSAIGLVLLGITVLVTIHELGHFLTAKAFGMRVETFSIGFPPKLFSVTRGETEYEIGATPLGGYVKISGMIDESLDTDHLAKDPEPHEFRAKPVWQRLIVMVGGVVMNVILGIFIFSMLKFYYGENRIPMSEIQYGIEVIDESLGEMVGFQTGDKLISFKGETFPYFDDFSDPNLLINNNAYFEVERNGQKVKLDVPSDILNEFSNDSVRKILFLPDMPPQLAVESEGPAKSAGLQTGDLLTKIDSVPIALYSEMKAKLKNKENQTVDIEYQRDGQLFNATITLDTLSRLMVTPDTGFFKSEILKYGFFESFKPGTREAFSFLESNIKGFGKIFSGQVSARKSVMGPVKIAGTYQRVVEAEKSKGFWLLTAMLSMILAFVNILPIPALDGGHVMFLLIEAVIGREPPTKVKLIAQQIGMVLILGLMVLIIFNDILNLF